MFSCLSLDSPGSTALVDGWIDIDGVDRYNDDSSLLGSLTVEGYPQYSSRPGPSNRERSKNTNRAPVGDKEQLWNPSSLR